MTYMNSCEMAGIDLGALKRKWREEQVQLKAQLVCEDRVPWALHTAGADAEQLRLVGGVDISFYPGPPAPVSPPDSASPGEASQSEASDPAHASPDRAPTGEGTERGVAALVVLTYPELQLVYDDYEPLDMDVPYCPGFLAFREVPAFLRLLKRAAATRFAPQVVLLDGCGILHPQGFGAACHLGVASDVPTIGVAKNLLVIEGLGRAAVQKLLLEETAVGPDVPAPEAAAELGLSGSNPQQESATETGGTTGSEYVSTAEAGERTAPAVTSSRHLHDASAAADLWIDRGPAGRCIPLVGSSGNVLGAALRPAGAKKPVYISIGHRVGLRTAVDLVWSCCRHRVPEPTRQADIKSRQYVREHPIRPAGGTGDTGATPAPARHC